MRRNDKLISYMQEAVERLIEQDGFENGWNFKKTQRKAMHAYANFLSDKTLPPRERLEGFFNIATGVGKTAIFVALVSMANQIAEERGDEFRSVVVVPTKVLLNQTSDEFNDIAPSTDGNIGFYGDGKRTLSKPITIMTYRAWTKLSDEEKLHAGNVDLLISDEAHRGTSKERTYISKIFNGVVRLAFTATPEFDPDKAVEHSHKHEIYSKPLPEAVRDGELAAYIQSQLHIIRAHPSKKLKDQFGGKEITGEFKRKILQDAWTKWAVRFYREGRDKQTGDLVSDNQAGFFVDNISHAISLRRALNSDQVLKKKAKRLGYKEVAIDVHSRISNKDEREKRIDEYKAGHYMAIIGDEMLKEGFDHKPMKTVIDWQHGSLVDKLQILGRGARKWFNKLKDRWEGLTFADTIVYMGDDNPEEDEWLRKKAIRKAVLASDILDGKGIVSSSTMTRQKKYKRKEVDDVFFNDDDVEEYTSLEDIKTILAERSELRKEHYIDITDDMRTELDEHMKRTRMGASAVCDSMDSSVKVSSSKIQNWRNGQITVVDPEEWDAVIQALSNSSSAFLITDEMRRELNDHITRTGVGAVALLNRIPSKPDDLFHYTIERWRGNISARSTQECVKTQWDLVIGEYKKCPDSGKPKDSIFTKEMHLELLAEIERTGIKVRGVAEKAEDKPDGFTWHIMRPWQKGTAIGSPVNNDYYDWAIDKYNNLPTIIDFTQEHRDKIKTGIYRTGVTLSYLINNSTGVPEDLTYSKAQKWLKRDMMVRADYYNWVVDIYNSLPDKTPKSTNSPKGMNPS